MTRVPRVIKIVLAVLLVYLVTCFGFYFFQDTVIFQPDYLPKDYVFQFDQPYEEYFIQAEDGESLNALLFRSIQPAKGLVLYFHGNADDLQRWGKYAIDFTSLGYDIVIPDYRGYGKSSGTPNEQNFYRDAETIMKWCQQNIPHHRLIIYGRSLGSAVASHLASKVTPDLLILETPFNNLHGVVYPPIKPLLWFLPLYSTFPNDQFLRKVTCRKIIFHGTDDWVVPLSSASQLKQVLQPTDRFVIIQNGSHKNLRQFSEYHTVLKEVLQ